MSPSEMQQDRRRRRRFSIFVAVVSVVSAASLYVGIMGLIENSSTDRDVADITRRIVKVERPSRRELAERLRLGLRECERRPKCRRDVRHRARRLAQSTPRRRAPRSPAAPTPGSRSRPPRSPAAPSPSPTPSPGSPSPQPGPRLPSLPLPSLPDLGLPGLPALP